MKLLSGFIIFAGLVKAAEKIPKSYYCDIEDLDLPANAEKWDCPEAKGDLTPSGSNCKLKCNAGFTVVAGKFTN